MRKRAHVERRKRGRVRAGSWRCSGSGGVLGFGVGVVLAFGRQSDQPFFSVPSVMVIELVRSGPLICWLYFAVFMMPDLMDPFFNAEDIVRMLLMF